MRTVLLIVALLAVAFVGYALIMGNQTVQTEVEETTEEAAPATQEATEEAEPAEEAAEEATEEATDATEEAETAVEEATDEAATAVEEATDEAATAVEEATDQAATAAEEATDEAATAVEEATDEAVAAVDDALTVDGFDLDRVIEIIDGSELSAIQKTTLRTGVEQARDNPELLQGVLDQLRDALGL